MSEKTELNRMLGPPPRPGLKAASPGAADEDCNSNTSLTGSQHDAAADFDAPCDNSDYLWFLDYNPLFRSGSCHHASVLSVSSYKGVGEPGRFAFTSRYDDLARDLDANLAEADMESFRTEDIHALLMTANVPRDAIVQHDETTHDSLIRGETIASITSSIMEKFRFDCSMSLDSVSQGDESAAGSINTMSLCKSELLFSPVKEPSHGVHFSVDSLDCELPSERELILTCRANKDNYTIAFEGSLTAYEDEGHCDAHAVNNRVDIKKEVQLENEANDERTRRNLELLDKCHKLTDNLTLSMARSDLGFTTWSKLKKQTCQSPLKRHGSGNNNQNSREPSESSSEVSGSVIKSQSLPNLCRSQRFASCSLHSAALSNSTIDSFTHTSHQRQSGAGTCMKVYDVAHNASCVARSHCSQHSEPMSTSSTENQSSTDKSQPKPSFNLVKLFMKQKSMSNEGIVSLDQLERSECWPSSSGGESDSFGAESKTKHIRIMEKLPKEDNAGNDEIDFTNTTEYTPGIYEPNILNTTQILTCNRVYDEALIEEEENGESANVNNRSINDSETNLYATVNKPQVRRNVNHMNLTNSPLRIRNVQSKRSCSSQSSATSVSISSCSDSDGTQLTRMHRLVQKDHSENRAMSTQVQVDTVDRSMQTSSIGVSYVASERDLIKIVEPSFLEKLKEGDCQKPVFVLYPNYALPDISFLNGRPNIYLNPQRIAISPDKKNGNPVTKGKRPFSCNDLELLRKKGFSHIRDWDSLKFLLPNDCKQLLSEVPEIMKKVQNSPNSKEKFCTSSPAYGKSKCRPMSCDCNNLTGNHVTNVSSSSSTATQPSSGYRGSSTMLTDSSAQNSPAPSNFNPLFVYRYDSATSSEASYVDKANPTIPRRSLSLAEQQKVCKTTEPVPPRPPLPKGILRKSMDKIRKTGSSKRYSMFEMDDFLQDPIPCMTAVTEQKTVKRRSLQEPYYLQKQSSVDRRKNNDIAAKRLSQQFLDAADKDAEYNEYYHDEGVGTESSLDSGKSNEVKYHRPQTPPMPKPRTKKLEYTEFPPPGALISSSELQQLEEFLELSGFSCENMDEWDQNQVQKVRKQVSKFFHMKLSQEDNEKSTDSSGSSKKSVSFVGKGELKKAELKPVSEVKEGTTTPPNSPNISVLTQRQYQQMNARRACRSAGKNLAEMPICEEGETSPEEYGSPRRDLNSTRAGSIDISQKRALVASVADAVEMMIQHFAPATDQVELAALGDSDLSPACAKIALNALCPALYAIFRDGLRENIETSFGAVNNSVWQMVEATARQGPITRSLNELVLKINSEDAVTEGLVKFNSFILGLLNAQSVDSWVSYMRTRESDLRKHYTAESLLRAGCAGAAEPGCRALLDALLASLRPLRLLPFRLQLMFEMRELHRSFKRIESEMRAASRPTTLNPPSLTLNQRNLLKLVRSLQSSFASSDRDDGSQNSVIMRHKEQTVVKNKEPSTPDLLNDSAKVRTLCGERSRPRSCVNPTMNAHDDCPNNSRIEVDQTRRWSGVQLGSKLMQAFDRLVLYDDSDDYTDSLENNKAGPRVPSNNTKLDWSGDEAEACSGGSRPPSGASAAQTNGGKFRKLQLKWELLSNGDSSPNTPPGTSDTSPASSRGSRIPRPVTSPVRPPAPLTSPAKQPVPAQRGIPVALRKGSSPTTPSPRAPLTTTPVKRQSLPSRASRVEQATGATPRPSSLPYGRTTAAAAAGKRRAASSSLSRNDRSPTANSAAAAVKKNKPRMVRTLWHRLPSDSGHLAFSEGERLRLVLEVDAQYLLCCRGDQKGLVPRDAVILESSLNKL